MSFPKTLFLVIYTILTSKQYSGYSAQSLSFTHSLSLCLSLSLSLSLSHSITFYMCPCGVRACTYVNYYVCVCVWCVLKFVVTDHNYCGMHVCISKIIEITKMCLCSSGV